MPKRYISPPRPGTLTFHEIADEGFGAPKSEVVYTALFDVVHPERVYLVDPSHKRTAVLGYEEAI